MQSIFHRSPFWLVALALLSLALLGGFWIRRVPQAQIGKPSPTPALESLTTAAYIPLPDYAPTSTLSSVSRQAELHTTIPDRSGEKIRRYKVEKGDTAWSIAKKFDLKPSTILWGNSGLSAEAGNLSIGATLNILPVDGVLHVVKEGETLESIAGEHGVTVQAILDFPGNDLSLVPPYDLVAGQELIVPGGTSPLVWSEPGPPVVAGMGRKSPGLYSGPLANQGTGTFIWPVAPPIVINQGYWEGHQAVDINAYIGQPVYASDSGTVIFADWSQDGFGNLVIIDHGNGKWTYYAHLTVSFVSVGQGVVQGQQIANAGSTGNSTGPHVDFRIRSDGGGFYNPMNFLPNPK